VKRQWILPLAVLLLVVLFGSLLAVDAVIGLYASLARFSPWLAGLTFAIMAALLAVVLGYGGYYGWLFLRPKRRLTPTAPAPPPRAAEAQLSALARQVEQIQDQVARAALEQQRQSLAAAQEQQSVRLVFFGIGSAGKTSLINAILQRQAGDTAAPLGTTTEGQTYTQTLPGVGHTLQLVDTPGIAEIGQAGADRQQQAEAWAAQADLLLFVVDNDLNQQEYAAAQALVAMGKRLLIVLNKADRFPAAELETVLDHLRGRFAHQVAPEDVVAVAAAPQPVPVAGGGWLRSDVNIDPLVIRLQDILRQDGHTLIADNILLQSQHLGEQVRQVIGQQRQRDAAAIVERYQWIGAGVMALTPLPGLDLLATAAVNTQMVVELGRVYDCHLSWEEGKVLARTLARTLGGLGVTKGAINLLAVGLQTNVATLLAGRAVQGACGAYLVRIAGYSFIDYFQRHQSWGDGGMGQVIEQQFRLHQRHEAMQHFIQAALAHLDGGASGKSAAKSRSSDNRPPDS